MHNNAITPKTTHWKKNNNNDTWGLDSLRETCPERPRHPSYLHEKTEKMATIQ